MKQLQQKNQKKNKLMMNKRIISFFFICKYYIMTNMFKNKYLKYKLKYLNLKNKLSGGMEGTRRSSRTKQPSVKASKYEANYEMISDNDGEKYIALPDKKGVLRWKRLK